ncbi:putative ribonuclease H-like domain-containing protein, partial [Tanacetum coccineum]
VPRTVLTRSGPISLNTARPVNIVQPRTVVNNAGPMKNVINNAYLTARRPFNKITAANYSNFTKKVNTVKGTRVNTARPKAVLNAVKENKGNAVKASTCWVWRPKYKVLDHGSLHQDLKDKGVIDSRCSRHMTGNRSYLEDYEEIDGGFVTFGGNSKRGKITGKRKARIETIHGKDYIMLPMWPADLLFSQNSKDSPNARFKPLGEEEKIDTKDPGNKSEASGKDSKVPSIVEPREDQRVNQEKDDSVNNTNTINTVIPTVNVAGIEDNAIDENIVYECANDPNMPKLEDIVYSNNDEDVGAEADMNNLDAFMPISPIPTKRIHKDHLVEQIIRNLNSAPQTKRMTKNLKEHAMQEELMQFNLQQVWTLVDLPNGKRAIGTKWIYRNKKDERGIVIKNKARLVAQGYIEEEGIDYDEVFAPVTRIEAIRLFLAYALFKDFVVYQMDVKSAFLYGKIIDHLGKFDGKADEGFFVGYSTNSKAFRVFNSRTRIVEENLHVQFSENTPNIAGSGPNWLFDIDALTNSMNYKPILAGNQSNGNACTKACNDAGKARMKTVLGKDYILLPMWPADPLFSQDSKSSPDARFKSSREEEKKDAKDPGNESGNPTEGKDSEVPSTEEPRINQEKDDNINSTNNINTASDGNNTNNVNAVSSTVNTAGIKVNDVDLKTSIELPNDPNMPELEDIVYSDGDEDVVFLQRLHEQF